MERAGKPAPLPPGAEVTAATARGLTLRSRYAVAPGAVVEFDLLLGARPMPMMGRVVGCRGEAERHVVEIEFVALAQVDRDELADFLTAVGPSALRVREHRED
jgi:hypothetical protein